VYCSFSVGMYEAGLLIQRSRTFGPMPVPLVVTRHAVRNASAAEISYEICRSQNWSGSALE